MKRFFLSQTILKDFETMCPKSFHIKYFGTDQQRSLFNHDSDAMKRGVLFETLAIGQGMGGKTAQPGDVPQTSVIYKRIADQAKEFREWEQFHFPSVIGTQMFIQSEIKWDRGSFYAQGNLDRISRDNSGVLTIIDLKMTGKADNDYGKFQYGNPRKVDWTQLIHYRMLAKAYFKEDNIRQMYYVADYSKTTRIKPLEVIIPAWVEYEHLERCQRAYDAITMNLTIDNWDPTPSYDLCANCRINTDRHAIELAGVQPCDYAVKVPDIEVYEIE